jgi:serine protease AprX
MDEIILASILRGEDEQAIAESGARVIAEYPDARLLQCTEEQRAFLAGRGVLLSDYGPASVRVGGTSVAFDALPRAEAPAAAANRVDHYLVALVGPAAPSWLAELAELGVTVESALGGNVLLARMLPYATEAVRSKPWVRDVAEYPAALKLAPELRDGGPELSAEQVRAAIPEAAPGPADQQVEIAAFPQESTADIAATVRNSGGLVVSEAPSRVVAMVPRSALLPIAGLPGVQSIYPHEFPKFSNDSATAVLGIPVDHTFGQTTLNGTQQVVHVADSGLDTGDPATVHADIRGRVAALQSLPVTEYASLAHPPFDDGPADTNSGHGTHVTGSVLGNGAAASAAGAPAVPSGSAPAAQVYFSAVEQTVTWKTAAELTAEGMTAPASWPPPAVGLYGLPHDLTTLFQPAYAAGARIHTNSWGADTNTYDSKAHDVDQFMATHRDALILFAAGNAGLDANADGLIDPGSIGSPATAKNCLAVGATENNRPHGSTPAPGLDANWTAVAGAAGTALYPAMGAAGHISDRIDGMACFSSRGPTSDNRVRPDVVAPGTNVLSTRSSVFAGAGKILWGDVPAPSPLHNLYCWSGGTSMATPLVAGTAALVREYLTLHRNHVQDGLKPSGALIKAFLINGAVNIGGQFAGEIPAGANSVDGFGRLNLSETFQAGAAAPAQFADEPDQAVQTGQIAVYSAVVADTAKPISITLAWTDPPSAAGVGGLQNQLYLRVQPPSGDALDGDLQPFPNAQNNVQRVIVTAPVAGTYQVQVHGVSVTVNSPVLTNPGVPKQDFAVVASNVLDLTVTDRAGSGFGGLR